MFRISRSLFPLAAAALAAAPLASAQEADVKKSYDPKYGLIALSVEAGPEIEIVTTDTVPGRACVANDN